MQTVEVMLPTGLEISGVRQREVWLRPWSGDDVAALGESHAREPLAVRTTELLGRCLSLDGQAAAGSEAARRLTVGDREALLLHLHRLTHGDLLDLVAECSHCGEPLELELRSQDLLVPTEDPCKGDHRFELENESGSISARIRLPTGEDQERAARLASRDEEAAVAELLRACVSSAAGTPGEGLSDELRAALAEKLGELDPQAEIRLAAICPECGAELDLALDAGELVHARFDRARAALYRDVHVLALSYHWSEAAILAMPPERRRRYLMLLGHSPEGSP